MYSTTFSDLECRVILILIYMIYIINKFYSKFNCIIYFLIYWKLKNVSVKQDVVSQNPPNFQTLLWKSWPDIVWAMTPRDVFLVDVDREEQLGEVYGCCQVNKDGNWKCLVRRAVELIGIVTYLNAINCMLWMELYKVSSMFLEPLAYYRLLAAI